MFGREGQPTQLIATQCRGGLPAFRIMILIVMLIFFSLFFQPAPVEEADTSVNLRIKQARIDAPEAVLLPQALAQVAPSLKPRIIE